MGGDLSISTYWEHTKLEVRDLCNDGSGAAVITVTRPVIDSGHARVTKARAGSISPPPGGAAPMSFLDIFVERLPDAGEPIQFAHSIAAEDFGMSGITQLLCPTNALSNLAPSGWTVDSCV